MTRARLLCSLMVVALAVPMLAGISPTANAVPNPVATNEVAYQATARVFSDPHGCLAFAAPDTDGDGIKNTPPGISPWAKGRACADQFLQYEEVIEGAEFLESRFPRFLDVIRLDQAHGKFGMMSAGIPRTVVTDDGNVKVLGRDRRPMYMFKVTDKASSIPERERKHFAYALSIHGIERAGLEGGVRAMEDLVTWAACELDRYKDTTPVCATEGPFPKKIIETPTTRAVPTAGKVLDTSVVYFFMPNPDGWARGQVAPAEFEEGSPNVNYMPGVAFQRFNGNGVDLNRDWPSKGYTFKPYSPGSEPETRAFAWVLKRIKQRTAAGRFTGGIDLHGMITANAFSYTLLGAGQRDFRKNALTVDTAIRTWADQTARLAWSPYIGDDGDGEMDDDDLCVEDNVFGRVPACVADQWGTVIDTIGYQVTGALGDWMDSEIGLNAVGIDNEMYTSHIIPNTVFDPALEQSHIDGNKGLVYSQIASLLAAERPSFTPKGRVGYVYNPARLRLTREEAPLPTEMPAQNDIDTLLPCRSEISTLDAGCDGATFTLDGSNPILEFAVKGPKDGFHNGGIQVTLTRTNVLGISDGNSDPTGGADFDDALEGHIQLQEFDEGQWHPIATDFNQSALYAQAGATVAVNDPKPGRWRLWFESPTFLPARVRIDFKRWLAEYEPRQTEIDASSMDFFSELNRYVSNGRDLERVSVNEVVRGDPLRGFDSLVVVNDLGSKSFLKQRLGLGDGQAERFFANLEAFARGGGNLVLTDRALQALPHLGIVNDAAVTTGRDLAMSYNFALSDELLTYEKPDLYPLARGVDKRGAAELERGRRQAAEPTPLGYTPDPDLDPDPLMPFWGVTRTAWQEACGLPRCVTALTAPQGQTVNLGEARLGNGVVRIAGIMFPDPVFAPDEANDHRFGVASYALTYTSYEVFENLINHRR